VANRKWRKGEGVPARAGFVSLWGCAKMMRLCQPFLRANRTHEMPLLS
jgi:hypothetical protein